MKDNVLYMYIHYSAVIRYFPLCSPPQQKNKNCMKRESAGTKWLRGNFVCQPDLFRFNPALSLYSGSILSKLQQPPQQSCAAVAWITPWPGHVFLHWVWQNQTIVAAAVRPSIKNGYRTWWNPISKKGSLTFSFRFKKLLDYRTWKA